jgi:hypothetical protein
MPRDKKKKKNNYNPECVQSLGICKLQGISRMEMQRCREKYQMMAQEEHVAVELEESEASDQTCFVAVAVASLLAVGLAAAAAVVAGSPLAASVAAGSVELAEQVPVTAVTGWAWQMSAAAAAAVELVAVAAAELAAAVVLPVARFVVVTAAAAAMQSCSESEAGYCQMVAAAAAAAESGPAAAAAAVAVVVAVAVEKIVVDAGEGSVDVTSAS